MLRILFVCTGNTCRSPMAEAILLNRVKQAGMTNEIVVLSAGIATGSEYPASMGAKMAMVQRGLDLSEHVSRQLLPDYIAAADIILTMTGGHKQAVLNMHAAAEGKVYTLAEYCGQADDVADPFGGSAEVYEMAARQIETLIDKAWQNILTLAGKRRLNGEDDNTSQGR